MAVRGRSVKNKRNAAGELTGSPGTVYDVNVKYKTSGKNKTFSKKGFASKKEAQEHEALMRIRLQNPCYVPLAAVDAKQTVTEFLDKWTKQRAADLRPSTFASYQSIIRLHIVPYIGDARMCDVTPEVLDVLFRKLQEEKLSVNTVKYVKRILSVSFEHARKYHYIETNPVHDTITRFGKASSTPTPYTVQQMGQLLALAAGTSWELIIVLGGLYGLRISEILGLRWENVDLDEGCFDVKEQLPYHIPPTTTTISEMAPVKAWRDIIEVQRANTQKVIESKEEQGGVCNAQI